MLMRQFTREDWYGWAGATPWPESEPYIGYWMPEGFGAEHAASAVVIADRQGAAIHWFNPDGECVALTVLEERDRDAAITVAEFSLLQLSRMGQSGLFAHVKLVSLGFETHPM